MAPKAVMKSPRIPPWPPTSAVRPGGGSLTTSRMSVTAVWISWPSVEVIGTTTCAALPSVEYVGRSTPLRSTCGMSASDPAYPSIARLSDAVRPPERSKTTVVGSDWRPVKSTKRFSTSVDSALLGRKEELLFFCTSESRPANDPSGPPTNSQSSTTTAGSTQRLAAPVESVRAIASPSGSAGRRLCRTARSGLLGAVSVVSLPHAAPAATGTRSRGSHRCCEHRGREGDQLLVAVLDHDARRLRHLQPGSVQAAERLGDDHPGVLGEAPQHRVVRVLLAQRRHVGAVEQRPRAARGGVAEGVQRLAVRGGDRHLHRERL